MSILRLTFIMFKSISKLQNDTLSIEIDENNQVNTAGNSYCFITSCCLFSYYFFQQLVIHVQQLASTYITILQ